MSDAITAAAPRLARLLATTAVVTVAAEFLVYEVEPGLGWALFLPLLWAGIAANRDAPDRWSGRDLALGGMLLASASQMVWRPSFSNGLVLVLLTIYLSGHLLHRGMHPWWRRFAEGGFACAMAPLRWLQVGHMISALEWKAPAGSVGALPGKVLRLGIIVLPSVVMAVIFLMLLGKGNAVLGEAVREMGERIEGWLRTIRLPGPGHVAFWAFIATAVLGLLWRGRASRIMGFTETTCGRLAGLAPKEAPTAVWATRMLLLTVNAVFFAANTIDVRYLWSETALPVGVSYSEYVHRGTANLLASVVLAAVLLGLLFSQARAVTRARGQRLLAGLWIAQNLLLAANVVVRVGMYVSEYQLSLLRMHLILFVALVGLGFVLLAVRIFRERMFGWLVGANLLAAFLLFFVVQFWDTRAFVAGYNVREAAATGRTVDLPYLYELGPPAWPSLRAIADAEPESPLAGQRVEAARYLEAIRAEERVRETGRDWRSFRGHRASRRWALEFLRVSP